MGVIQTIGGVLVTLAAAAAPSGAEQPAGFSVETLLQTVQEKGVQFGLQLLAAVLIFIVGRVVAGLLARLIARLMKRAKAAPILVTFSRHFTYVGLMIVVVLAALSRLGVQVTSFIAILGAAGLAIGLALQGSLANFAAGVLLIVFRPFKVGDFVDIAGEKGTVEDITIFTTQIVTRDNRTVIVPNASITDGSIVNYTSKGTRRVDLVIGVGYDADLKQTRRAILDVLSQDSRVLKDPEPTVAVLELGGSSVNFAVRPWCSADDYWSVYFDTQESVKERLDAEGINIPFPQQDVHLYQHGEVESGGQTAD
ncbi:MAG: mechanosensitive ion channel [Candidatus Brocadiia bacterium]